MALSLSGFPNNNTSVLDGQGMDPHGSEIANVTVALISQKHFRDFKSVITEMFRWCRKSSVFQQYINDRRLPQAWFKMSDL